METFNDYIGAHSDNPVRAIKISDENWQEVRRLVFSGTNNVPDVIVGYFLIVRDRSLYVLLTRLQASFWFTYTEYVNEDEFNELEPINYTDPQLAWKKIGEL